MSAEDLVKLVDFWIRRGEGYPPIISPAGLARIERSGTLPYPKVDNEYGFANYVDVSHPTLGHGHDGGSPGFHASYRYFSDLGVGYVMLLNGNYTFRGYKKIAAGSTSERGSSRCRRIRSTRSSAAAQSRANPRSNTVTSIGLRTWAY